MRSTLTVALLLAGIGLVACSGAPSGTTGPSDGTTMTPVTPATSPTEGQSPTLSTGELAGWEWEDGVDPEQDTATDPTAGEPSGEMLPGIDASAPDEEGEQPEIGPDGMPIEGFDPEPIDPCALIFGIELWPDWLDRQGPVVGLEDGEACGWFNQADDFRLAIAVFEVGPDARYLTGMYDAGSAVDFAERSTWLAGWPVAQSSTLVVESGSRDLVIEVSARTEAMREHLYDAALHFAREILVQLP